MFSLFFHSSSTFFLLYLRLIGHPDAVMRLLLRCWCCCFYSINVVLWVLEISLSLSLCVRECVPGLCYVCTLQFSIKLNHFHGWTDIISSAEITHFIIHRFRCGGDVVRCRHESTNSKCGWRRKNRLVTVLCFVSFRLKTTTTATTATATRYTFALSRNVFTSSHKNVMCRNIVLI